MSQLLKKFNEAVGTSQPLVLIRTDEWDDAESTISDNCKQWGWQMHVWDVKNGVQSSHLHMKPKASQEPPKQSNLPPHLQSLPAGQGKKLPPHDSLQAAIDSLAASANVVKEEEEDRHVPSVLVVRNLHLLWRGGNPDGVLGVIQTLQGVGKPFKQTAKMVIGLSIPGEMPPPELLPIFKIVDHKLPVKDEFKPVVECVDPPEGIEAKLSEKDIDAVSEASCGLTRLQAEEAYATAMLRYAAAVEAEKDAASDEGRKTRKVPVGPFFCEVVEEEKNAILNADGMLKRWNGAEDFDSIGGNEALKEYLKQVMLPEARRKKSKRNCSLLVGPPGTGKTLLAKALGKFTGRKTYGGNLSSNKSKWVGESEANARRMFNRATAMGNVILYFDEINEQVASGESEGHSVDTALRQYLMEWLDTHWREDDVYVVMTANDISKMHMALTRPGRVDAIWYVGLPGKEQKKSIWSICIEKYGLDEAQYEKLPKDYGWAGVEIDACCAQADNFGITLEKAAKYIIPSSVRVKEQIADLQGWAHERCLDAETGELFLKSKAIEPEATGVLPPGAIGGPARRKVLLPKPVKK